MNCWWTRRPEDECRDKDHQCLLQSDTNLKTHPIIYLDFGSLGMHFISTWLFGLFPQRTYLQTYSLTDMWIEDRTSFSPKSSLSLVDLAITVSFLLEMIFIRSLYFFFFSPLKPSSLSHFLLLGVWDLMCLGKEQWEGTGHLVSTAVSYCSLATGLRQDSEPYLYLASFLYNFLSQVIKASFTFITLTFEEFHYKS